MGGVRRMNGIRQNLLPGTCFAEQHSPVVAEQGALPGRMSSTVLVEGRHSFFLGHFTPCLNAPSEQGPMGTSTRIRLQRGGSAVRCRAAPNGVSMQGHVLQLGNFAILRPGLR